MANWLIGVNGSTLIMCVQSESVEELQKENEELKEVLNVVQLDLETKTEVC